MNHLKRKLEKLTNGQLKHVCNKMGVKHSKSKKLTIINLLKPFVKKYKYLKNPDTSNTDKKISESYGLWRATPGLAERLPTMKERVKGLLFRKNEETGEETDEPFFDETDIEAIEYLIYRVSDQDRPIYELNLYIIQYHVTGKKISESYGLWRAPRTGATPELEESPTMDERVKGLLFRKNEETDEPFFDETDIEAIEYLIYNRVSDQDRPIYELNLYIIQYHVNNPEATKDEIIEYAQSRREREEQEKVRRSRQRVTDG